MSPEQPPHRQAEKKVRELLNSYETAEKDKVINAREKKEIEKKRRFILEFLEASKNEEDRWMREESLHHSIEKIVEFEKSSGLTVAEVYKWIFEKEWTTAQELDFQSLFDNKKISSILKRMRLEEDSYAALSYFHRYKNQPYAAEVLEKAVKRIVEKNPSAALIYFNLYKDKPYAKEMLERIAKQAAEKDPCAALKSFEYYKDQPYAGEVLEKAAKQVVERTPSIILEYFDLYKDQSYAEYLLKKIAQKNSRIVLEGYSIYKNQPYAFAVLEEAARQAAKEDSRTALKYFELYKNQPYAAEVLEKAARQAIEEYPWAALVYFNFYKNQPYAKEVVKKAAEARPRVALMCFDNYKDQPYAGEILEGAVRQAIEKRPDVVLKYFNLYKNQPYAEEVLERAAKTAVERYPDEVMEYFNFYESSSYAKKILEKVAKSTPGAVLRYFDHYKDQQYAEEILEKAARRAAEVDIPSAIKYFAVYKNQSYALEVLEKTVKQGVDKEPAEILLFFNNYKDQPYAGEVLEKAARRAAEENPNITLISFSFYKDQPYANEVLEKVIRKNVYAAFIYFDNYKDQPYAGEVLEKAARQTAEEFPYAAFEYFNLYKGQPYAEEVLEKAARNASKSEMESFAAFKYFYLYKDQPYAREVLTKAAENNPELAIEYWERIKYMFDDDLMFLNQIQNRVAMMGKEDNIPSTVIKEDDFPLDQEYFKPILFKINKKSKDATITIPMEDFNEIFFSSSAQNFFKKHAGELTYMNAFSLVQAVYRKLTQTNKKPTSENIERAFEEIYERWEQVKDRELFGPNTKLILFSHEEERFNNEAVLQKLWKRSGGKEEDVLVVAKGIEMKDDGTNAIKEKVLAAIRSAKGPTTILFEGHGSQENWAFIRNTTDDLNHSLDPHPRSINYRELGDALIASGNINQFNIIGSTCFAYDYFMNLFAYLESKGINEKPFVSISIANKDRVGLGEGEFIDCRLLDALYKISEDKKPINVEHFFKAEGLIWEFEDPVLFVESLEKRQIRPFEIGMKNQSAFVERLV